MAIHYVCRHCGLKLGEINAPVTEEQLGFHTLNPEEKQDILLYQENGDIVAQVTCEHCQEAIERNPEWLLLNKIHH
ncbi:hypothetical protein CathTA2_2648 [Caldalkalibacillus thermarum TA2.A1]|uniref:Anti-sigma-F factor Fin family protein n=1 Tax=Caldalkalibacillus thermarum (strain TA2.A1) TaxID=986075 RepID=F5L9Z3_CALTT|nr:anti-sigma-F factor Fin family protein [Caldalkalibacillus thermarum]EGL81863.1 hypothetical protein CathTA2_2648 [Caldalkalibacillus thermarum TA2.A1]QZT34350.1 anti-sigma-F factor Fin family protein [Caldalkalibacillus thermarum TA2.A1]GGK32066.1 anti-sigma-F factor Fin [Caldalkalibacillus thermarum]